LPPEASNVAELHYGKLPLIVSLPHVGTELPEWIAAQLTDAGRQVVDTDWNVQHLYAFAREAGASWLQARYSRYAIDMNRPPDDQSLYPGQTTTELCPTTTFDGQPLYRQDTPGTEDIAQRRERYWVPYHAALQQLIAATRAQFGYALLLDAHSIRSEVPRLFDGRLPDVNVGTHSARSCAPALAARVTQVLNEQQRFSHVLNGRFKGGYITRAYGDPSTAVHALQFELAQSAYLNEDSSGYDAERARPLQELLRQIVTSMLAFNPTHAPA